MEACGSRWNIVEVDRRQWKLTDVGGSRRKLMGINGSRGSTLNKWRYIRRCYWK